MRWLWLAVLLGLMLFAQGGGTQTSEVYCAFGVKDTKGHTCHCPAMVHQIQDRHVDMCEKEHSQSKQAYLECMKTMPDACEITEHSGNYGIEEDDPNRCSKYCHPWNCKCNDTGCRNPNEPEAQPKARKNGRGK